MENPSPHNNKKMWKKKKEWKVEKNAAEASDFKETYNTSVEI